VAGCDFQIDLDPELDSETFFEDIEVSDPCDNTDV